jgi:LysM repeat protein/ABC-type branched-subunit amino acid transport system substrate-binding protein
LQFPRKYNIPVEVLSQTNNLQNGEIKVGQSLLLPYGNIQYREKRYFFHEVQKGESLYSISKHYKTDITKIMSDNPCTKSPLKHGMVLKIEISLFNKDVKEQSHKDNIIFHEVAKGETAYSIAKKYNVDYKKLRKENSEYDLELLSDGIILKVPTSRHQIAEYKVNEELRKLENGEDTLYVEKKCECDSISTDISRTIRVAVLLPFYLKANDTINNNKKIISSTEKLFPRSIPFLEFYEGMLVALDTLKQYGYNVSISTYDTQDDTSYVKRIFNSITKNNTDIIIGPVFYNTFQVAARIAKQKNIPIVSPLAAKNCCVDDNNKLIVVNTPNNYRIESTAFYFSQYVDQNFVIIHNGHIQEFDMMKEYKNALATSVEDSLYYNNITFKQVYFAEQGISGVEDALSKNAQNIIIIPSNSQGYVSDIVTQLYQYQSTYNIQLYGLSNWETFDNIELKYLYELNFHFATSNYINYNDVRVISFIENFRNTFSNDPSKFTFQGYDLMMYFVRAVQMYPNNMLNCLDKIKSEGFQVKFDFRKEVDSGAFVNRGNYLIRYNSNFTREEINFRQQDIEKQIQMKAKEMQKNKKTDSILTPNPNYIPFNK